MNCAAVASLEPLTRTNSFGVGARQRRPLSLVGMADNSRLVSRTPCGPMACKDPTATSGEAKSVTPSPTSPPGRSGRAWPGRPPAQEMPASTPAA